ncbi:MAG: ATP-binding protein [Dorea formicigenerans]|nr:ATP-binding protein [Dorea formicigenerans]
MKTKLIKIGDRHKIATATYDGVGVVTGVHGLAQIGRNEALIDYDVENYEKDITFLMPGNATATAQVDDRRARSGMPKEYMSKTANDFNWCFYNQDTREAKTIINKFICNFPQFQKSGYGLYIYSDTKGSGKTLLSCCIANEILKKRDISVKFISVSEYIELAKSGKSDNVRERINSILDAGLLIFDEIGAIEENKDWISNAIFRLVDYRYTHILPTIYTSNVESDKLKCDERAKDRIFELSYKIHMPEESIRKLRAERRRSEFMKQIK